MTYTTILIYFHTVAHPGIFLGTGLIILNEVQHSLVTVTAEVIIADFFKLMFILHDFSSILSKMESYL